LRFRGDYDAKGTKTSALPFFAGHMSGFGEKIEFIDYFLFFFVLVSHKDGIIFQVASGPTRRIGARYIKVYDKGQGEFQCLGN
jgi:hypothetical protein